MNSILAENSQERQRLLRELEILRRGGCDAHTNVLTDAHTDKQMNCTAGRISVNSSEGDLQLLDTEFEYLKGILYKYLKGEHTEHLLKVIIAILRYSKSEKTELLTRLQI